MPKQPYNNISPFRINTINNNDCRVDENGVFNGDFKITHSIEFPDGSRMISAGVTNNIDAGTF